MLLHIHVDGFSKFNLHVQSLNSLFRLERTIRNGGEEKSLNQMSSVNTSLPRIAVGAKDW